MPRDIDYIGQTVTIEDYEDRHRPDHQEQVEGFPLNPCLRPGFDSTPNEERDPQEIDDWWERPYIKTVTWVDFGSDDEARRQNWFEHWPTGIRYDVRCLDGGAWDRSTNWGQAATLEEALAIARTGPAWRRASRNLECLNQLPSDHEDRYLLNDALTNRVTFPSGLIQQIAREFCSLQSKHPAGSVHPK